MKLISIRKEGHFLREIQNILFAFNVCLAFLFLPVHLAHFSGFPIWRKQLLGKIYISPQNFARSSLTSEIVISRLRTVHWTGDKIFSDSSSSVIEQLCFAFPRRGKERQIIHVAAGLPVGSMLYRQFIIRLNEYI